MVPFTLQVTTAFGLESTEQQHVTTESSRTQVEECFRITGLSEEKGLIQLYIVSSEKKEKIKHKCDIRYVHIYTAK